MMAKRVIPCLDVHNGQVTRGVQFGIAERGGLRNVGDPVELALRYNEHEGNHRVGHVEEGQLALPVDECGCNLFVEVIFFSCTSAPVRSSA